MGSLPVTPIVRSNTGANDAARCARDRGAVTEVACRGATGEERADDAEGSRDDLRFGTIALPPPW
jgi:hypothetical protein